ncbi:ATP/GTP-binding protein [Klenkia sp. PcliD-1-E]|uniref:TRAFAC clade GTPase domain-containing protein n=1 Tax=Klenkia sp. PcliD-1-E TaxID=2954492 RepID=UPI00209736F9|nr:ATP/GTP-binding protein [Klenkia sp. PcliD-1-E]MCO7218481.1 ATP/GTP-binding protein [Klenkia sp. PcliD-1-E]
MPGYPRIRRQSIAVFGESGSGKTVLVSSFFGPTQEGSFKNDLWDVVAQKAGQGNRLYQNYLGMRDSSTLPSQTRFANTTYDFAIKLKNDNQESQSKRPFDELHLVWHDYPGEWFEEDPDSEEERRRRTDTFRTLLSSDVALLLVDGQKLLDYRGEEERYLKSLIGNFRQSLVRLKPDLLGDKGPLVEFPRIWILSLSKSDLLSEWDVDNFRDLLIRTAADDMDRLRSAIADLVEAPEALSVGEDFMLLSSAKFELGAAQSGGPAIDVTSRVGLDLILPIASLLPLERRVLWEERMTLPRKVVDSLADGADVIAAALTGAKFSGVDKLLKKFAKADKRADFLAKVLPLLAAAVKVAGPKLKEVNEHARAQNQHLRAMLTQFKMDLEQGVEDRILRAQK